MNKRNICKNCTKWTRQLDPLNKHPEHPEYYDLGDCSDPHFVACSETHEHVEYVGCLRYGGFEGYGDCMSTHEAFGCIYFEKKEKAQ